MKVLVACERSGKTRDAFIARGHDAISCDLHPSDAPGPHYQGDVRDLYGEPFDLLIAHPDCTYLASSGLHWNHKVPGRAEKTEEALAFVRLLLAWPNTPRKAIENPIGCISTRIRKPDQIIQPHQFGHDASKSTCLWLENLPPLTHTARGAPVGLPLRPERPIPVPRGRPVRLPQLHGCLRACEAPVGQPDEQRAEPAAPVRRSSAHPVGNLRRMVSGHGRPVGAARAVRRIARFSLT